MQELIQFTSNHPLLSATTLALFILLIIVEVIRAKRSAITLSPANATQLINHEHAVVIDIRDKEVFKKGHIIDAQSMTEEDILKNPKKLEKYKNKPLILVCATGTTSQKLSTSLKQQGYNANALAHGMRAWNEAQMPVIKE